MAKILGIQRRETPHVLSKHPNRVIGGRPGLRSVHAPRSKLSTFTGFDFHGKQYELCTWISSSDPDLVLPDAKTQVDMLTTFRRHRTMASQSGLARPPFTLRHQLGPQPCAHSARTFIPWTPFASHALHRGPCPRARPATSLPWSFPPNIQDFRARGRLTDKCNLLLTVQVSPMLVRSPNGRIVFTVAAPCTGRALSHEKAHTTSPPLGIFAPRPRAC